MARKERELTNSELTLVQDFDALADSGAGEALVKSGGTVTNSSLSFGDASGPGSSTDNAIARFDGTGGKTLQNSGATIDDTGKITAGANGTSGLDVVTYQQLQDTVAGLSPKDSVRVATTANGTLATAFQNGATVDGITLATGDRILIKNQTSQDENGIYTVNASGAPTRATDGDTWDELVSAFCFVEEGSTNADTGWVCTINSGGTLGVDNIAFTQFTSSGSGISSLNGLSATSQTFATGTSGTDFNISSATSTHTFNIPDASGTNRGLVTTVAQTLAGAKTFSSAPTFSSLTASKPLKLNGSNVVTASDINLTNEVSGTLPINRGGTNSAAALNNNRFIVSSGGAIGEASAVTASRAVATDVNGLPTASATTATELGYLSGVTSAVQTQLDGKADDGDVTASGLTMNTARVLGRTTAGSGAIEELTTVDSFVSAASTTTVGKIEIATVAEVDTGTDATRAVSPDSLAGSNFGERVVGVMLVTPGTDVATGTDLAFYTIPSSMDGMNLVEVHAEVKTAGTTGVTTFDINKNGTSMLSTKLTIDSAETGSDTAATAAVIDGTQDDVSTYDVITIDVDGVSTTAPQGAYVTMIYRLP